MSIPDGEVTITANGQDIGGWTDIAINGGLDMAPATFSIGMTETNPSGQGPATILKPGDACEIKIGSDLVLTGWINRVQRVVTPNEHVITVQGRSRVQDLVDCSALPPMLSIVNQSIASLAAALVQPFKGPIAVQTPDGNGEGRDYQINVTLGETPWEIINQIANFEGLLVHDDARGDLVICRVGTKKFASGFAEGQNAQAWSSSADDSQLFSLYRPVLMSQDTLSVIGPGGNEAGPPVNDPGVARYRPLAIVSEQQVQGEFLAQKRAVWEATRRRGRSVSVSVGCDSWRDSAGTLWTHNMLASIDLPSIGITGVDWIVATWNFVRNGQRGTVCDITLMPPQAFSTEPSALQGTNFAIAQASQQAAIDARTTSGAGPAITAPNAGAGGNVRAHEGYGL
jgi:prophage tail gpP-like protein